MIGRMSECRVVGVRVVVVWTLVLEVVLLSGGWTVGASFPVKR